MVLSLYLENTNNIFFKHVKKFLNNKYVTREKRVGPDKYVMYVKVPYISDSVNRILNFELQQIVKRYFPQIMLKLACYNNHKLKSYFHVKETLPVALQSSLVYCFKCSNCLLEYIGSTKKNLCLRVDEHRGHSSRTSRPLVRPLHSSIRAHSELCNTSVKLENFEILFKSNTEQELRISESIYIKLRKPALNSEGGAHPLYVF